MERVCENCAGEDDDLVAVRRVYVTPEAGMEPAPARSDVELWCFSCRSQYAHELLDGW